MNYGFVKVEELLVLIVGVVEFEPVYGLLSHCITGKGA